MLDVYLNHLFSYPSMNEIRLVRDPTPPPTPPLLYMRKVWARDPSHIFLACALVSCMPPGLSPPAPTPSRVCVWGGGEAYHLPVIYLLSDTDDCTSGSAMYYECVCLMLSSPHDCCTSFA